jgi:hypothetical protein
MRKPTFLIRRIIEQAKKCILYEKAVLTMAEREKSARVGDISATKVLYIKEGRKTNTKKTV